MADVKVSALTALTGADLANGDQFLVTDVGSPNVSKSITADELAQGSQFSSRYVPKAGDTVWVPPQALTPVGGSPAFGGTHNAVPPLFFDQSSVERVSGTVYLPQWWSTFVVDLWWVNITANTGDVYWSFQYGQYGATETITAVFAAGYGATSTAGAEDTANKLRVTTTAVTLQSDELFSFRLSREADNVGDTLAADAGVLGLVFTRVS